MRNIPTITKNLLIINILAYLASVVFARQGVDMKDIFGLHFCLAEDFRLWQFITYMFMHNDITHLFFNMFALWMFGCTVERAWGERRFLYFYMACGLGAGLLQEVAQLGQIFIITKSQFPQTSFSEMMQIIHNSRFMLNGWTTVGASGAVYGILLGFGLTFPEERIFIFPFPFPIKGKWFVCIYAVVELFSAISTTGDGVAHTAHLGGMLIGYIIIRMWRNGNGGSQFGGWDGYEITEKKSIWKKLESWIKDSFSSFTSLFSSKKSYGESSRNTYDNASRHNADWDYNKKEKERDEEIDRILAKISRSGYESLTEKEKRTLFDRK